MSSDNRSIGRFLDYSLWEQAIRLLNYQIERKQSNRHFNTLSMFHYERLDDSTNQLQSRDYFEQKIANNLFYGLEKEFAVIPYVIPKAKLGLRSYRFFTYPLRVLLYAIGLYLLRLSQEFITNYVTPRQKIRSYYGGRLQFENDELMLTRDRVYFQRYYKAFKRQVRQELRGDLDDKVVLRIDIQNYYDNISIPILLNLLAEHVPASQCQRMNFNAATQEQILSFFEMVMHGERGIPQCDNDIVPNFLGYLYLTFGDLFIEQELYAGDTPIQDYKIIRYVDDIFISLQFEPDTSRPDREAFVESLASRIRDILYYRLDLKLNPKTRMFWLNNSEHVEQLKANLKKVSPAYYVSEVDDDEQPINKLENIFDELEKLKGSQLDPYSLSHELQEEILKDVFDRRVAQMLNMQQSRTRINQIFDGFNFNLVTLQPLPILIVLLHDPNTASRFREFLLAKQNLSTSDTDLILTYLCQTEFSDNHLVQKLRESEHMAEIMAIFQETSLPIPQPGYFQLTETQVFRLVEIAYVIEQVRLRRLSENIRSYSVALNHLLNEIHALAYVLNRPPNVSHTNYNASHVVNFLQSRRVSHEICIGINNLFDRRNTNQVSHPGSENSTSWGVDALEYQRFHRYVGECLKIIL